MFEDYITNAIPSKIISHYVTFDKFFTPFRLFFIIFTEILTKISNRILPYICQMKSYVYVLAAFVFLLSCGEKKALINLTETYKSDSLFCSIQYAKNWEVLQNPQEKNTFALVEKLKDSADAYQENLVCWFEEMPIQISDSVFFHSTITQLKISNPTLQIQNLKPITLGKNTFQSFHFEFVSNDKAPYEVFGFCLMHGKLGYNFACTANKKEAKVYQNIFHQILSTFNPL